MAEQKRWAGLAGRSALKAANNLGIVAKQLQEAGSHKFRNNELDVLDSYYEGRQYSGMTPWKQAMTPEGAYIPVRERAPLLQYNFAKVMCSRLASKIVGQRTFPLLKIEDDPDTEQLISMVIKSSRLKALIIEPTRRAINSGSCLVRFSIVNGQYKIEHYLSKWCYPQFDANDNLVAVRIQYVWEDKEDLDDRKLPKKKWFRMDLGQMVDVKYNTPDYNASSTDEPEFEVEKVVEHELGFVQATWIRTAKLRNETDGPSMISDILGFIDELNYSLSQSSQAVSYNQDPQLILKGMDEEEVENLIRSSQKGWNLGREGEASFLEAGMSGVEAADNFRGDIRLNVQDIARVIMLDPEKIVGSAQSGKAMEVLHGPMVELVEELRPSFEKAITELVLKMTFALLIQSSRGAITAITIPPGYKPKSLNIVAQWPEIFPKTMQDLRDKVSVAAQASSASLISRETLTKWLAKDFDVENIEEELAKIEAQPVLNPFGAF